MESTKTPITLEQLAIILPKAHQTFLAGENPDIKSTYTLHFAKPLEGEVHVDIPEYPGCNLYAIYDGDIDSPLVWWGDIWCDCYDYQ